MEAQDYRPHWVPDAVVYDVEHFRQWVMRAKQTDRCLYHVGQMRVDQENNQKLRNLGNYAILMSDFGAIVLTQKRIKEGLYQYFAARTDHIMREVPIRVSTGQVSVDLFKVLLGIADRAENMSVKRSIRDSISCSERQSAAIMNELIDQDFLTPGRPPQLTELANWALT